MSFDRLRAALAEHYTIEREIGRGGNAVVYLAHDQKHDRQVALKVLLPELALGVRTERFLREIQIAAKLSHPHILGLHDSGSAEGFLYFVMPYVEGESLRDRLQREKQLPLKDALQITRDVAEALSYAHSHDVVHRDIKPENILLQAGQAVVADFGIARALTAAGSQSLTQTGVAVGTPLYMSPEQAAGSGTLDGRSDVYSLACVVYEMLAGQPPFTGQTPQEVLAQHALDPVPPFRKLRPEVPAGVEAALTTALAKQPAERFPTVARFAAALVEPGNSARLQSRTHTLRRSSGVQGLAALAPIRRFRLLAGGYLGSALVLILIDLVTHRVLFGPIGALVAAFLVADEYGRLWTAGFTWRNVITRQTPALAAAASPQPLDLAELGPHRGSIQQARNDRAAMLALVQGLPGVERKQLGDLLPTIDALVAHSADDARRLYALERQLEPGPETIARRLADTRGEAPSPGREQRIVVLERRLQTIGEIAARRERLAAELTARLGAVSRVRFELDRAISSGLADGLPAVAAAREEARTLAQTTG